MAAAHDYVANSTSSYPVAVRTIQRILARDDKTTAELVDQVYQNIYYLFLYQNIYYLLFIY